MHTTNLRGYSEGVWRALPPAFSIIFLIAVWGVVARFSGLPAFILPSPGAVFGSLWANRLLLAEAVGYTVGATLVGLVIAVWLALVCALVMDVVPLVRRALYPLIVVSQTIQILAVAPLIILWVGLGARSTVAIVVLFCFFPVVISLLHGFEGTPASYVRQMQVARASRWQVWRYVRLPFALPALFAGLRIATTYSVVAATIGEWVGGTQGLGLYVLRAKNSLQTARLFGGVLVTTVVSVALFVVVVALERVCIPWQRAGYRSAGTERYK